MTAPQTPTPAAAETANRREAEHLGRKLDQSDKSAPSAAQRRWRDILPIDPAADKYPLMKPKELRALADDIATYGLRHRVVLTHSTSPDGTRNSKKLCLLDGRNRLDALEFLGEKLFDHKGKLLKEHWTFGSNYGGSDEYASSANLYRRHLSHKEWRDRVAEAIAKNPEKSDRIAEEVGVNRRTVVKAREQLVHSAPVEKPAAASPAEPGKRVGKDGKARKLSVRKPKPVPQEPIADGLDIPPFLDRRPVERAAKTIVQLHNELGELAVHERVAAIARAAALLGKHAINRASAGMYAVDTNVMEVAVKPSLPPELST